jgi:hypothetical protein
MDVKAYGREKVSVRDLWEGGRGGAYDEGEEGDVPDSDGSFGWLG